MALPTFVANGLVASAAGAAITPPFPAGILANDILLLFLETANQAVSISNPGGGVWTEAPPSPQGTGSGTTGTRLTIFWSRYDGLQLPPTTSAPANHVIGYISAFRGCVTSSNPIFAWQGNVQAGADISVEIPGTTTGAEDHLIIAAVATGPDISSATEVSGWTNTNLANVTERNDQWVATANGGGIGFATGEMVSPGNYGTTTATLVTSFAQARISLALSPPIPPRRGYVYYAEFEAPTAPRVGRIYHVELETPDAPRRGIVYFVETEFPDEPRRGRTYWAVLQVPPGSSFNDADAQDFLLLLNRRDGGRRRIKL